jgi:hypothetical protein
LEKFTTDKKNYFFDQKLQFTYPQASLKDFHTTGKAVSPLKKISITSKHEIPQLFLSLLVLLTLLDPDPADQNQCGPGSATLLQSDFFS